MANLAGAIQQGSAQQERFGSTLSSQASVLQQGSQVQLQQEAMKMKIQENYTTKANAGLSVIGSSANKVSSAKKTWQDSVGTSDEVNAKKMYDASVVEYGSTFKSMTAAPSFMASLYGSNMFDEDITKKLRQNWEDLLPEDQQRIEAQMLMAGIAEEKRQAVAAEHLGNVEEEKTAGRLRAYEEAGLPAPGQGTLKVPGAVKNFAANVADQLEQSGIDLGITSAQLQTRIGNMDPVVAQAEYGALSSFVTNIQNGNTKAQMGGEAFDLSTDEGIQGYARAFEALVDKGGHFGNDSGFDPLYEAILKSAEGDKNLLMRMVNFAEDIASGTAETVMGKAPFKGLRASAGGN